MDKEYPYPGHKVRSDNHPISIFYRGQRRARVILERYWPRLWISRMMVLGVGTAVKTHLSINKRLERYTANCPFAKADLPARLSLKQRDSLEKMAEDILHHQFDLLGSGPVFLGRQIRWHSDFVTGFDWEPSKPYYELPNFTPTGSDIKRPWELSRCQHFIPLGIAWQLIGKRKFPAEYVTQIIDWIGQNPAGYGVNWACPMDVAIRAVNWLAGYALFCTALLKDEYQGFRRKLTKSLWEHARFIETHLEWNGPYSERRANHFLANVSGLFTLGIFFSDTKLGRRWLRFSRKWLEIEINRQVLDDGVHFECATSYHRLCHEMFLWCYHLGLRNNIPFSGEYKRRLEKMGMFCSAYTRPDGLAPLIGDNDDGRLLFSNLADINDHCYLWRRETKGGSAVDGALYMGKHQNGIETRSGFSAFPTSGYYVYNRPDAHLIVRAGRLAHVGDHAHCDQLSFELSVKGVPIFIDRGSYVYTSDPRQRNLYRGTRAHNVLSVNGAEQNRPSDKFFGLMNDTQTKVINGDSRELMVRHTGFKTLNRKDISHTRIFRFPEDDKAIEIYDIVKGVQDKDNIEWYFHLSPALKADFFDQTVRIYKARELICEMNIPPETQVRKERFDHSPSYGRLQEAQTLVFSAAVKKNSTSCKIGHLINWRG